MNMRRSRSHVPHPPHLMEPSSMEPFVNLLAELQRHCDFACFSCGMSTSPSLCLDMFGHVWTCDLLPSKARPYEFGLLCSAATENSTEQ